MNSDALREAVKAAMIDARRAREAAAMSQRLDALDRAHALAITLRDPAMLATVCWRLSKARFDAELDDTLFDALTPLLDPSLQERGVFGIKQKVGPFDHYRAGLRALEPLTRRHWDHQGYTHPTAEALWTAWIAVRVAEETPFLEAWGHVQWSWHLAVTGQIDAVDALVQRYARLPPHAFDDSPHQHARAADAASSLPWVQLDLARTYLRCATWAGSERRAWVANELLEDAAEEVDLDRSRDPWFLDATLRAAERFAWQTPLIAYTDAFRRVAEAGTMGPAHTARARAWCARQADDPGAPRLAESAARICTELRAGPEWIVESWLDAAEADPHAAHREHARAEASRYGVVMAGLPPDQPPHPSGAG